MSPSDPIMSDPRWMFYCVMNASEQDLLGKHRASDAVKWRIEGRLRIPTGWAQACHLSDATSRSTASSAAYWRLF